MKKIYFIALIALVLIGCGAENNSSKDSFSLLSEDDFFENKTLSANENDTVMLYLEHPQSSDEVNDTSTLGIDSFRYRPKSDVIFEVGNTMLDANSGIGNLQIVDENENIVLSHQQGDALTEILQLFSGKVYTINITHDEQTVATHVVFANFNNDSNSTTRKRYHFPWFSKNCSYCDLNCKKRKHKFHGKDFSKGNIAFANFSSCNLTHTIFDKADLHGTELDDCTLSSTSFVKTRLDDSSYYRSKVYYTDFSHANLKGADFFEADITGSIFNGANLSGAIWVTQRKCANDSIGVCK